MTDIFISYSRKDIAYARLLHEAIKENGFETWIDWQDIPPSTDWLQEVYGAIEQADTFIFVLSASSSLSEICKLEIEHARKNNKRLIPIVINDVNPSSVHPALAAINWIFSRTNDEFQPAIADLMTAIQTDYEWVKAHTRLQMRALEWERANGDKSFLLRGSDLSQAEEWFSKAAEKTPEPSLLQTQYLQTSRQEAVKRQRTLLLGVGAALIITAVLGVVAVINGNRATMNALSLSTQVVVAQNAEATAEQEVYVRATQQTIAEEQRTIADDQREIAEAQRTIAKARELASVVQNLASSNLPLAQLLAVEGYRKDDSPVTRSSLLTTLQENPQVLKNFYHNNRILDMQFLPDGTLFASTGDRVVHFWDPESGKESGEPLIGHVSLIRDIAIHPDGKLLASAAQDGAVLLWDIPTRTRLKDVLLTTTSNHPELVAFSLDGKRLAASTRLGEFWLWDTESLKILTPNGQPLKLGRLRSILFTPDNGTIITLGSYVIEFWDAETLQKTGELLVEDQSIGASINKLALRPDGKILAGSDHNNAVYFWNLTDLSLLNKQSASEQSDEFISDIVFHPSGTYLFSIDDQAIRYWSGINGQHQGILRILVRGTNVGMPLFDRLQINPAGNLLLWGDSAGVIQMQGVYQQVADNDPFAEYSGAGSALAYSPNGKILAVTGKGGDDDYAIHLWEAETMTHLGEIPLGKTSDLSSGVRWRMDFLLFHPQGYLLYAGIKDQVRFFDVEKLASLGQPLAISDSINNVALNSDGSLLAVSLGSLENPKVQLWDLATRQLVGDLPFDRNLYSSNMNTYGLAFSTDGQTLVCGHSIGYLTFWDAVSLQQIGNPLQVVDGIVNHVVFHPSGDLFATVYINEIRLWDAQTLFSIGTPMIGHTKPITSIVFSADGGTLISSSEDATIQLWDVDTQQAIGLSLDASNARNLAATTPGYPAIFGTSGHEVEILNIALAADDARLTSKDADGNLRTWDFSIQTWLTRACQRAGRNLTANEWATYLPDEPYRATCASFPPAYTASGASPPNGYTTRTRSVDGAIEVFVPAGEFEMGYAEWDIPDVRLHSVYLDAYWIDQTEVTNAQYTACVTAGVCSLPNNNTSQSRASGYYGVEAYQHYPALQVTWQQAMDYCTWVGGRLPSEAEWERAAKGEDQRNYPWGDDPPRTIYLNFANLVGDTMPVGSYPQGISPVGALDMSGNAAEWVYDYFYDDYYEQEETATNPMGSVEGSGHVFRGGSWYDVKQVYTWIRSNTFEGYFSNEIGFRCRTTP